MSASGHSWNTVPFHIGRAWQRCPAASSRLGSPAVMVLNTEGFTDASPGDAYSYSLDVLSPILPVATSMGPSLHRRGHHFRGSGQDAQLRLLGRGLATLSLVLLASNRFSCPDSGQSILQAPGIACGDHLCMWQKVYPCNQG